MSEQTPDTDTRPEDEAPNARMYCTDCERVTTHRPVRPSMAPDEVFWQCVWAGAHGGPHSRTRRPLVFSP